MNRRQQLAAKRRTAALERQRMAAARICAIALDQAKAKTGSDWKTAQVTGVSPGYVCHVRKGRRPMSPFFAMKLSLLLNEGAFQWVLLALAHGARNQKKRDAFLDFRAGVSELRKARYERWAKSPSQRVYTAGIQ
ncbi:MAG: hypothetical protein ACLGHI_08060 [Gammaproteobacteria bacterium]